RLGVDGGELVEGLAPGVFGRVDALDGDDALDDGPGLARGRGPLAAAPASASRAALADLDGQLQRGAQGVLLAQRGGDERIVVLLEDRAVDLAQTAVRLRRPFKDARNH